MYSRLVMGLFLLVVVLGCSKSSRIPSQETPAASAVGSTVETASNDEILEPQGVYPHSDKFRFTNEHGLKYYEPGSNCTLCHGKALEGRQKAPACNTCHGGVFPHTESFRKIEHGDSYFKDRKRCATCHGFDYQGGNTKVACAQCHRYPHSSKWAFQEKHGKAYVETLHPEPGSSQPIVNCLHCHDEKSHVKEIAKDDFVSCGSCHLALPHSQAFIYDNGHDGIASTYEGKCTLCHTDLKRNLPSLKEGCRECHDDPDQRPIMKWVKPDDEGKK